MMSLAFADVVTASQRLAGTRSRLAKAEIIGSLLAASPEDIPVVVGFLVGAARQGRFGVGYRQAFGVEAAPAGRSSLTVVEVDGAFEEMAAIGGPGAVRRRNEVLRALMERATSAEQVFIREVLTGGVRHGALEGVVVDAAARVGDQDVEVVRRAAMLTGDLGEACRLAVTGDRSALESARLAIGRGVLPMLASSAPGTDEALEQMAEASVEWKLDGARIQVHRWDGGVRIFTRNLNDVTDRLSGVVRAVSSFQAGSFVLDGEAMALDGDGGPRPFQETMSDFGSEGSESGLVPFFFDLIHLDGKDLFDSPLRDRLVLLDELVPGTLRVPRVHTSDPEQAAAVLTEARVHRHEGVMVKDLSSPYEAGRRGASWVKVKPAYTLDLVVLAVEWGHGRRAGKLSNIHLGALDAESGEFVMLGKTFKGMTDAMLDFQTKRFLELEERRTKGTVFVRPEQVVEIAFDGVLPSPRYPAGMALRFARVKRYRDDKSALEADTIDTVRAIFERRMV